MHSLRTFVINLAAWIGIIASIITLLTLTGFLIGFVTPHLATTILATWATKISASKPVWFLSALIGWVLLGWSVWLLVTFRREAPILIREDETGSVEVSGEALKGLARAEIIAHGGTRPSRAEFARKFGRPVLKVWCDLTAGNDIGPIAFGQKLKTEIENRLRRDFSLNSVRVEIIHHPVSMHPRKQVSSSA